MESVGFKKMEFEENSEILLIDVFNMYYNKIFNFFSYHIYNYEQAQDMTGEVFLKVAAAWPKYDRSKGAVSTWIFTIAKNVLYDNWRKKIHIQVELQDIPDNTDLYEDAEKEENKRMLRKSLSILSPREKEVISLKYSSELKNTEIAVITGLSNSNVGIVLFRAIKKLREDMKTYYGL